MEILKGLGVLDTSFLIPVIIVAAIILIIAKVAKSILKLAVFAAVIAIGAIIYFNLPSFSVNDGTATLDLFGKQHTVSVKDAKVITEQKDGKTKAVLVSGGTRIELPFSKSFADKFIMEKLKEER
ncbi:hypothetical protein CLHUN_31900 [Ruminiclostridium hungatei]|uniref:Uncharacterized protein n=1 Tax=Ruminiclostridium hungatei TaxID=48256 RepID=A0A1V4SH91_RUMHU|nr:hypothetical protein [Ruminiclostridium hungatei]OPX42866.1 hypothetical protein CLHUN_31900 [Ruminiclostridium hungatei]